MTPMRRMSNIIVALLVALPVASASGASAGSDTPARILTSPPRILASVAPGTTTTAALLVANQSRTPVSVRVHVADLGPDPDGASFGVVHETGDTPRGAGSWISVDKPVLRLGAGAQQSIKVRIDVPPDASAGGHYGALVVEQADDPHEGGSSAVKLRVRLVSHVEVLVPGDVEYGGRFTHLHVTTGHDGRVEMTARFENTGNIQSKPRDGELRVSGRGGRATARFDVPETLPDGTRDVRAHTRIPGIAGHYHVQVRARLEDGSAAVSRTVTVLTWRSSAPRLLVGLVVLLVLLVLLVPFLRRRRELQRLYREELERDVEEPSDDADDLDVDDPALRN
jgi:hypothetical protein